jgi:hypothetical protein
MDDLVTRWQDFQAKPFPHECAGREIQGIDLVALDTFTAGCISTYADAAGGPKIVAILTVGIGSNVFPL